MRPLDNIDIEPRLNGDFRLHANVCQGRRGKAHYVPMYADGHARDRQDLEREALHCCIDLLASIYGGGLHKPWQAVYFAYRGDITRQVRGAISRLPR